MSIPIKGARKITVDSEQFLWSIRRKPTYSQECFPGGCLHVAIQDIEQAGSTLVIVTDRSHPQGFCANSSKNVSVTPADLKKWIRQAKQLGWMPNKPGKSFELEVWDGCVQFPS